MPRLHRSPRALCGAIVALLLSAAPATAQTYTWNGSAGALWSNPNNWNSTDLGAPPTGSTVVLTGSTQLSNTLDYSFGPASLTFNAGAGAFVVGGTGTLTLGAGGLAQQSANIQTFNANLTVGAAQSWTTTGALSLGGSVTVGTSLLTLAGAGGISSSGGALSLGSGGLTNTNTGTVTLNSPVTLTAASTITKTGTVGTFTVGGAVNLGANLLTVTGTGNSTYSGIISGAGGLTKAGAGTVTLSGANSYTGATTITAGILRYNTFGSVGGAGANVTVNSGAIVLAGFAIDQPFLDRINQSSGGVIALGADSGNDLDFSTGTGFSAARLGATGAFTYSGTTLTPAVISTVPTYMFGGGGGTLTVSSNLGDGSGGTALNVGLNGTPFTTVVLSGTNSYTGPTTVTGGALVFSSAGAVGGSGGADITITSPGAVSVGFPLDQTFLVGRIVTTSTGTIALGVNSSNDLDFNTPGFTALRLGASAGTFTYSGTLTPNGTTYRLGGGGGTLTMANALVDVSGTTSLDVGVAGVPGAVVLNSASTYTGTTTINAGTLRAGAANVFAPTSAFTVASGSVLDLNSLDQTIGSLAGGGNTTLGTGNLTLGGNNASTTYSGLFTGSGTITKTGTGKLTLTANSTWTGPLVVNGGGIVSIDTQTRLNSAATGTITLDNGTIEETNPGSAGTFTPVGRNIVLGAGGGTLSYTTSTGLIIVQAGTVISGPGGLTKAGVGVISVVTPATYTGPTHVVAGTLRVRTNSNVFPTATALTVDSGATFDLDTLNQQVGSLAGAGIVNVLGGTFTVGDSTSTAFSGVIQGTNGKVIKLGAGTLSVSGASTYTGATTITAGVLSTSLLANGGVASGIGQSTNAAANLVLNGGTLQYTGAAVSTDRLFTLNATGGAIDASGSGALTLAATGNVVLGGTTARTLTLTGTSTDNNTFASVLGNASAGATSLTKTGAGTWILTAANTYTGATTISGGILSVSTLANGGSNSNIGASTNAAANLVLNGGTFRYTGAGSFTDHLFSLSQNGGTIDASGSGAVNFTNTGSMGFTGTTARTLTLTGTNTGNNTLAAVIGDVSAGNATSLAKVGAGTWVLTGASTYTGATTINGGVLAATALNNGGAASSIGASDNTAASLVIDGGTLQYTGAGSSTDRLFSLGQTGGTIDASGSGAVNFTNTGGMGFTGTTARTLTLAGTNTGPNTLAAVIGDVSGGNATSLTKAGAGTWVLTGANTYTGATTVNGGALFVNGQTGTNSGTGTGNVTVNSAGTFGGTGRASGNVTITGGTISAGDATGVGTLTIGGNLTLDTNAKQLFRITAAGTPAATTTGGSSIGSAPNPTNNNFLDINGSLLPTSLAATTTYHFTVDGTGAITDGNLGYSYQVGRFTGPDLAGLGAFTISDQSQFTQIGFSQPRTFTLTGDGLGGIYLNLAPVPEPATVLGLAAGVLGLGGLVRRRLRREV